MRILSRYIVRRYVTWLVLALTAFVAIFLVVDLTDRLNEFLDRAFEGRAILNYYLFYIPYVVVLTLPMASLLACLFAVGDLSGHGELTAMKSAGLSLGGILTPLVGTALALSLAALLMGDRAVPGANRRRAEVERGGTPEVPYFSVRENLVLRDAGGQVLSIGRYDVGAKVGRIVSLDRYEQVQSPESGVQSLTLDPGPWTPDSGSGSPPRRCDGTGRDGSGRTASAGSFQETGRWRFRLLPSAPRVSRSARRTWSGPTENRMK